MVMALENRVIPPNIKFNKPNPKIPFGACNLKVPLEPTPWPDKAKERASINSFGIGGTNAHVILESARTYGVGVTTTSPTKNGLAASTLGSVEDARDGHHLLLYSSNSSGSLQKTVDAYETFVASNPSSVAQLAYTLANGREHLSYRSFAVATSDGEVSAGPLQRTPTHDGSVVMIFTGQGAQWVAMGASLLRGSASSASIFQASIRSLDRHLRETLITPPEWSLEQQLLAVGKNSRLHLAEVSQPLCAAVQIGLVDMLAYVGVKPAAVVGHSSGEIAAAYAAGALTAGDAIVVAWLRGVAAKKQQRQGSMAAIGLGWDEVKPYLAGTTAVLACENSPNSVTISGDTPAVETVVNKIKQSPPDGQQEVLARLLKIDKAYHSHHMAEVGEDYQTALEEHQVIGRKGPRSCLFYSSVTGKLLQVQEALGAEYWRHNLESPVLFSTAVSQLLLDPEFKQSKAPVFVEVGPHSAMAGPLRQILAKASVSWPYVATMIRSQNCVNSYLTAVGRLHQLNIAINLRKLIPRVGNKPFVPDLPRYAWDHEQSAWWEPRASKEWRSRKYPYHELLGLRTTESTDFEPAWRNLLHVEHSPWIRDHIIVEDVVFPFSGYVAMAAEAIRQISKVQDGYALRHVIVSSALVVPEGKPLELLTTLRPVRLTDSLDSAWWEFTIASHNGATWNKHCTGQVRALDRSEGGKRTLMSSDGAANDMPRLLKTRRAYSIMREFGLCYGPQFQSLQDIKAGTMEKSAAAHVVAPNLDESGRGGGSGGRRQQQPYHIHPIIIDACLQILSISATKGFTAPLGMVLPTLIEEIEVYRTPADVDIISHANMDGLGAITGSAQCSADGEVVLRMSGARLSPLPGEEPAGAVKDAHSTAVYKWSPVVDLVDMSTLIYTTEDDCRRGYMSILDDMTSMCVVYTNRRLQSLHTELQSMARYATWIREQSSRADPSILRMEDWQLFDAIGYRLRDLRGTPAAGASMAMFKIITSVTAIFQGRGSALDALLADESLAQTMSLRDSGFDCSRLLRQFALSRPNMRVLELNAGMGDQTANVLRHVVLDNGQVMYSAYTYSDPSSGMLVGAKERFKSATNMQYAVLDIAQPLDSQDVAGHEQKYDIIIATNVLHGTPKLRDSLTNMRELLRPNGYVLMQEFCSSSKWLNFIMGVLPRWWNGVADGRTDEPYVDLASWQSILRAAGLDTAVALADSQDKNMQQGNFLVAKHVDSFKASPATRDITLLCRHDEGDRHVETDVAKGLESEGYHVHLRSLGEQLPVGQDVIAMLDQHGPFFDGLDSHRYDALKSLAHKAATDGSGILWITSLCQMSPCQSPSYAQIFGTARTLRSEAAVALATCEVDDVSRSIAEIAQVFQRFQLALHNGADDEVLDPDYEYAISNNVVHVGHFLPFSLAEELLCHGPTDTIMLETKKPGNLAALTWARQISVPPEGNHVEVKVCASGLNFRVRIHAVTRVKWRNNIRIVT
jgi:acyl transferase domain-containing protein